MISVMSTTNSSGVLDTALHQETGDNRDNPTAASTTGRDEDGEDLRFNPEETTRVSSPDADRSDDITVDAESVRVSKLEKEDYQLSSSVNNKKSESKSNGSKSQQKKVKRAVEDDYDTDSFSFDEFGAGKGRGEGVGYGYEVGDMVWGKVKSHPWWPGHIFSEAFASASVRRSKREGHVLVAFFGDSSYGWFEPAELIPFEENFAEKSKQMFSRAFINAVDEAVDELSRRSGVGLVCRCRNEYNFWPSKVDDYFTVDVGDYEPGLYSLSQIKKSRDSFQPRDMLSFLQQLALTPMNSQHWEIEFLKNKARVLACRKALFEEFDETYAQAFGTVAVRPPRPTAPVSVDPSKAPLSGRLVIAEVLGKGKISAKPTKTKDQIEKDKYLFKRRDELVQVKSKKELGTSSHPVLVDGSGYSGKKLYRGHTKPILNTGVEHQTRTDSEGSQRFVEGGTKKPKAKKRPAEELSSGSAVLVEKKKKKRKKEIGNEASADLVKSPVAVENSVTTESIPIMPLNIPLDDTNPPGNEMDVVEISTSSSPREAPQLVDFRKFELSMLVKDLRGLALNPFHGEGRCCPAIVRRVFWKFRSLVYKKSLVSLPRTENEANESAVSSKLPAASAVFVSPDKNIHKPTEKKLVKPSDRPDDPTKGGIKRGPLDRPEGLKKKKKVDVSPEDIKKKKKLHDHQEDVKKRKALDDLDDIKKKKKKMDDGKILAGEKKIPQMRSTDSQKESAAQNMPPALKLQSSKGRIERSARVPNPTMLIMKFPNNAALPSSAELRAKFARFGQLDHSATRVFWKSFQCRLVYHYKSDAEGALRFAVGNANNLFGSRNVRSFIRAVGADESEPSKTVTKEEKTVPKFTGQPIQQSSLSQLKSILKKPAGDEGGNNGNGKGSSSRVKFVLGGEEASKSEPLLLSSPKSGYKNNMGIAASAASASLDTSSKNIPSFVTQPSFTTTPTTTTTATTLASASNFNFPINVAVSTPFSEQQRRAFNVDPPYQQIPSALLPTNPTTKDISQPMLNLLMKCSDVVNNVTRVLGYLPYHPI